jgi:hypothetical protein
MIFSGFFLVSLAVSIACCVHVVRTNQNMYWLWLILIFQPLGALIYFIAVIVPSIGGGPTARRIGKNARDTLDPTREYRAAQAACEQSGTVANRMRLAKAAAGLGRWAEAEQLYGLATQGIHAEDPALLFGRAQALVELDRPADALPLLERLAAQGERAMTPAASLAMARALEGMGRLSEAEAHYDDAAGRMPGLEAIARQAAFLARVGRVDEARVQLTEIDRRISGLSPQFRREGRQWRDLAARSVS